MGHYQYRRNPIVSAIQRSTVKANFPITAQTLRRRYMTCYRTKDNDMLDAICHNHYGNSSGYVEAVLEANHGLAAHGAVLSAGIVILLPELPELKPRQSTLCLWH
jgi:phage tail protein X